MLCMAASQHQVFCFATPGSLGSTWAQPRGFHSAPPFGSSSFIDPSKRQTTWASRTRSPSSGYGCDLVAPSGQAIPCYVVHQPPRAAVALQETGDMGMMSSGLLGGIESNKHIPHRMCTYCIYIYILHYYILYILLAQLVIWWCLSMNKCTQNLRSPHPIGPTCCLLGLTCYRKSTSVE